MGEGRNYSLSASPSPPVFDFFIFLFFYFGVWLALFSRTWGFGRENGMMMGRSLLSPRSGVLAFLSGFSPSF